MWEEFNLGNLTVSETIAIIDDALCYLFEFKVEGNKIYFRETS